MRTNGPRRVGPNVTAPRYRQSFRAAVVLVLAVGGVVTACGGGGATPAWDEDLHGQHLEVVAVWQDAEAAAFVDVLRPFEQATGATVTFTSTSGEDITAVLDRRLAADDLPDVAVLPQPGLLERYARAGAITPIGDIVGDQVEAAWAPVWRRLGTVDGTLYGLWFKAADKSLVWYSLHAFEQAGVVPPDDLEGLGRVARAVAADGTPAFSLTGDPSDAWTLTDWFENLYLRIAGPERYDALAEHRLPWTDPTVGETLRTMASLLGPGLTVQPAGPDTTFPESVLGVFAPRPAAAMIMEGDFVPGVVAGSTPAQVGVDVDVFAFPGRTAGDRFVVGAGDAAVLMRDSPAVRGPAAVPGVVRRRRGLGGTRWVPLPERGRGSRRLPRRHHPPDRSRPARGGRRLPLRPVRPAAGRVRRHDGRGDVGRAVAVRGRPVRRRGHHGPPRGRRRDGLGHALTRCPHDPFWDAGHALDEHGRGPLPGGMGSGTRDTLSMSTDAARYRGAWVLGRGTRSR